MSVFTSATHVSGRNLDDPDLVRFLAFCADGGIPVLVHPAHLAMADKAALLGGNALRFFDLGEDD